MKTGSRGAGVFLDQKKLLKKTDKKIDLAAAAEATRIHAEQIAAAEAAAKKEAEEVCLSGYTWMYTWSLCMVPWLHVCACIYTNTLTKTNTHTYTHIHTYTRFRVCAHKKKLTHAPTHAHTHTSTNTNVCV